MNEEGARRRAEAFAREVETAMVDLPRRRRTELTADLVDHLLEPGDDGLRLIDEHLDPQAYAAELQASAPAMGVRPGRRPAPYLVGAAILALVIAVGAWIGTADRWGTDAAPRGSTPTVSPSPGPAQVQVPDVRAMSQDEAVRALESVNLSVQILIVPEGEPNPWPTYLPSGTVVNTDPFHGTVVDEGSPVMIFLTP